MTVANQQGRSMGRNKLTDEQLNERLKKWENCIYCKQCGYRPVFCFCSQGGLDDVKRKAKIRDAQKIQSRGKDDAREKGGTQ